MNSEAGMARLEPADIGQITKSLSVSVSSYGENSNLLHWLIVRKELIYAKCRTMPGTK